MFFDPNAIFDRLKGRVSEAELIQAQSESHPIVFKANRLKSAETSLSCVAGLRVVSEGRIGFAFSNDPDNTAALISQALGSAKYGDPARFTLPASCTAPPVPALWNEDVAKFSREEKIRLGASCIDALLSAEGGLNVDLTVETSVSEMYLSNMRGLSLSRKRTLFESGYSAFFADQNGFLWLGEGNSSCNLDIRTEKQAKKTATLLSLARRIVPAGKPETVILEPGVVSTLVSSFLAGINGKTVFKGASPLAGKIGARVADSRFSLIEDPLIPGKTQSASFDGEGAPRSRKALIDGGVLKMFIYDLQTAGLAGTAGTGNASRGASSLPSPGYSNLVVPHGDKTTAQMIKDTKNGLWVHSVLGSGQSNMLAGDFSLNAHLAFRVENGEITGRVKDTMISGNVYDVFNRIIDIGGETDDSGSHLFPPISFMGVNVSE